MGLKLLQEKNLLNHLAQRHLAQPP